MISRGWCQKGGDKSFYLHLCQLDRLSTSGADLQPVPIVSRGRETALEQRILGSVTHQSLHVQVNIWLLLATVTVELQEKYTNPFRLLYLDFCI